MFAIVLLPPNTNHFQQVEDYARGCTTATKYWPLSTSWRLCLQLFCFHQILIVFNKWKIISEVGLLLPNTDHFQQVEDYVRGCSTTTQILIAFNMLKIMSEVVLLLPNTDCFQQAEDYVRGCTTSTKYWPLSTNWRLCPRLYYFYQLLTAFNKLKIMSEIVLLLPNTDRFQQVEDYVEVVLLLPNTDRFQQVEDYVRGCTTSTKYWSLSTSGRLCPRLYYFYQILTTFNKLKIMSEVVLLLPNTDRFQQVEDYVRGCTTSTKYRPLLTSWSLYPRLYYFYQLLIAFNKLKIMSEVVLLLPNTHRFQQVEDYVRGCTTFTKYWPLSTNWRLCQRLYYFFQILTAFNKLKIMSEVVLLLPNTDHFQQVEVYIRGCTTSTNY
jgi:uncharacterized protein (DUF1499 family)